MGLDLCHGRNPGALPGLRPEIVGQSDLHQPAKVQRCGEITYPLVRFGQVVTVCFLLGSLVAHAPFYSGILQGLQVSDVTPYS